MEPIENRRWGVRQPCPRASFCRSLLTDSAVEHAIHIDNLSRRGLGFFTRTPFAAGTLLTVQLRGAPGRAGFPRVIQVRRVQSLPTGSWFVGASFPACLSDRELAFVLRD